jgi:hypothetical protein
MLPRCHPKSRFILISLDVVISLHASTLCLHDLDTRSVHKRTDPFFNSATNQRNDFQSTAFLMLKFCDS